MYKYLDLVAVVLLIVGGLNWGLVAFAGVNLVELLFGGTVLAQVTYGLVAASAVYKLFCWVRNPGCCG